MVPRLLSEARVLPFDMRVVFALPLLTSALACGLYRPPLQLSAAAPGGIWDNGRPGYQKGAQALQVTLFYHGQERDMLVFDVELLNTSSIAQAMVAPYDFSCTIGQGGQSLQYAAIDPEQRLRELAKARRELANPVGDTLDGLSSAADLVGSIADLGDNDEAAQQRERERRQRQAEREAKELARQRELAWIEGEERRWKDEFLRRTTLLPERATRHLIAFRVRERPEDVTVSMSHRGERLKFPFRAMAPAK